MKQKVALVFKVLLWMAFFTSCLLLVMLLTTSEKCDYTAAGELLLVAVLSLEGIVAISHLQQARLDSVHKVLVDILMEYRSAEMLFAVRTLWDFYRANPDTFVCAYESTRQKDAAAIAALSPENRLDRERATLHFQRRFVSQFYAFLAGLYELGIIPKQVLYTYWSEDDLRIIPEILIPIDTYLAGAVGTTPSLEQMKKLYDDSPKGKRHN